MKHDTRGMPPDGDRAQEEKRNATKLLRVKNDAHMWMGAQWSSRLSNTRWCRS